METFMNILFGAFIGVIFIASVVLIIEYLNKKQDKKFKDNVERILKL